MLVDISRRCGKARKEQRWTTVKSMMATHPSKPERVIIFLDIDGVLLPFGGSAHPAASCGRLFPNQTLAAFSIVLEAFPDAGIVLSSTWRVKEDFQREILDTFQSYGYEFGGPLMDIKDFYGITDPNLHTERQHEIYAWLQAHNDEISAWICLDDEDLLEGKANARHRAFFQGHVILADSRVGVTEQDSELAVAILRDQLRKRVGLLFER